MILKNKKQEQQTIKGEQGFNWIKLVIDQSEHTLMDA
jgi:hypothetical protein